MRVTLKRDIPNSDELYPSYRVQIDGQNVGSMEWRFFMGQYGFWSDYAQWFDAASLYKLHSLALELTAKHCKGG